MTPPFADYMVFVDESGSPGMGNIDPRYPLFEPKLLQQNGRFMGWGLKCFP